MMCLFLLRLLSVVWCGVCVFVCWIVFQLVVVSAFLECVLVLYSP